MVNASVKYIEPFSLFNYLPWSRLFLGASPRDVLSHGSQFPADENPE